MTTQMIICIVIFALTLISYILNKIPMWLTAMLSLALLFITGCVDASTALSGFANTNTVLMATMFVVAAGFRRTSLVDAMVKGITRLTKGSFRTAYFGYLLIALLLTNFIASPMVVYAIVSPLICAYLDSTGKSRSKYLFPVMVVCVSCCGILPLATAVQQTANYNGFIEQYAIEGVEMVTTDFFKGAWPILIVVPLWALFLAPKFAPDQPSVTIEALERKAQSTETKLTKGQDVAGIIIFFVTIVWLIFSTQINNLLKAAGAQTVPTWWIALLGSLLMVLFGVVEGKSALRDIPWDMIMLYVGALALGGALTSTGAGDVIGNLLATAVGGTHNSYVLGALFFIIPFILTQFMLNRSVQAVFVPICLLACKALGANPIGLILLVNAGALTAFLTPMATPAVPMVMADGGYNLKDLFKSGWLITIILCVVYIAYTMTVFPCF